MANDSREHRLFGEDTDFNAVEEWMILGGDSAWIDNRFWSQIADERVHGAYDYNAFMAAWREALGEGGEWYVDSPGLGRETSKRLSAIKDFIYDCNTTPDRFFKNN